MRIAALILFVFLLSSQIVFSQSDKENTYIPKNLEDCFSQLNIILHDSIKAGIKLQSEEDFCADSHFGLGLWMRNNWGLWGGSRLSKYFTKIGINHPDDMSAIILVSYHRQITGKDIGLKTQIEGYKAYWKVMKEPEKKGYPKGVKNIEFDQKLFYNRSIDKLPGCIHVQTNSESNKTWVYDYYLGWKELSSEVLKVLNSANPEDRENVLKNIFKD